MSFNPGGGGGSSSIAGSTDVALSNVQNSQVLAYDNGAAKWQNQAAAMQASSMMIVTAPATVRPTDRTDIGVLWVAHATQPVNALPGDLWMPDLGGG